MERHSKAVPKTLGQKIKELRKLRGFTQEQLARDTGVAYTTLTKVENDAVRNPSFETVAALARGLGVSLDVLTKNHHGK